MGTRAVFEKTRKLEVPLKGLTESLNKRPPHKIAGSAVFFTSDPQSAPTALLHSLKHYKVLHAQNIIFTIKTADAPRIADSAKLAVTQQAPGFTSIVATIGFMEQPDVPALLKLAALKGVILEPMTTSYFLSRRTVLASPQGSMPLWQDKLFIALAKSADDASHYFRLPTDRVVEVGNQITI